MIVALDPGATSGVAVFTRTGLLTDARAMPAGRVWEWLSYANVTHFVHERPQIYNGRNADGTRKSAGDPNKLLPLYGQALELFGRLARYQEAEADRDDDVPTPIRIEYTPATWKGQVPKEVHHARILARLTSAELADLPPCRVSKGNPHGYDNNMLDAIGLGLFYLGRTLAGGVTPDRTTELPA